MASHEDRRTCWCDDYWVRHSVGFRVERPDGSRLGVVDAVRCSARGEAAELVVRESTGSAQRVPAGDVEGLDARREVVLVRLAPQRLGSGRDVARRSQPAPRRPPFRRPDVAPSLRRRRR
jgi:hypothetical protein